MAIDRPRLHCHTPFQHYQMYHRDSDSSYGNSVFNYTYNINSAPLCGGGFWNSVLGGIGMGIGNLFGGMLGNIFGGFGFGGCFGGGMFGGGFPSFFGGGMMSPFSLYGNSYLNNPAKFWSIEPKNKDKNTDNTRNKKTSGKDAPDNKTAKPDKTADPDKNADEPKTLTGDELSDLIKKAGDDPQKLQALLDDKKYNLTEAQKKQINDKIKKLNDDAAKKAKEDAEAQAEELRKAQEDDDQRRWPAENWNKTPADVSKVTVTNKKYTKGDGKITIDNLKGAYDSKMNPVEGNTKLVSNKKYSNTNYPEFLSISDNDGNLHKYKCVGLTKDGYAVYKTPDSDENKNYYVAVYDTEEQKYKLVQDGINDPSGTIKPGKPDKQDFDTEE